MEALGESLGGGVSVARQLQIGEKLLELVGNAVLFGPVDGRIVPVRVDVLADLGCHEERLDQRVHVACGALVLQADIGCHSHVRGETLNPLLDTLQFLTVRGALLVPPSTSYRRFW